jgi:hypothetical protein
MSYNSRRTIAEQKAELQAAISERLNNESTVTQQRVYDWLSNNYYFSDNELFDFYLCVAQNLAAVEELGRADGRLLQAQVEIQQTAEQIETRLNSVNLDTISTGLVNAIATILKLQKQVLQGTEAAKKIFLKSSAFIYAVPIAALLGWGAIAFFAGKLHEYNSADAINNRALANQTLRVRQNCLQQYLKNFQKMNPSQDGVIKNCPGFEYKIPPKKRKVAK